jgi:hypothetical protein
MPKVLFQIIQENITVSIVVSIVANIVPVIVLAMDLNIIVVMLINTVLAI